MHTHYTFMFVLLLFAGNRDIGVIEETVINYFPRRVPETMQHLPARIKYVLIILNNELVMAKRNYRWLKVLNYAFLLLKHWIGPRPDDDYNIVCTRR